MNAATVVAMVASGAAVAALILVTDPNRGAGTSAPIDGRGGSDLVGIAALAVLVGVFLVALVVPRRSDWHRVARRLRDGLRDTSDAVRTRLGATRAATATTKQSHENEVYDAWRTFIEHIGEDETTAPGEAARIARESGLPPDHVATLKETFETVRYGDATVTEKRIEQVHEALAAIISPPDETATRTNTADGSDEVVRTGVER
jgi:hypothetical protein